MPKDGFKSITIPTEVYDDFFNIYIANKHALRRLGVNSLSSFITMILYKSQK